MVGLVALFGSSGPNPSSPSRPINTERGKGAECHTIGSILAIANRHNAAVLLGSQCKVGNTSTTRMRNLASPSANCLGKVTIEFKGRRT
jgi:hypothetical protein